MIPIKSGGTIIGAHMTNAEKKALEIEVRKTHAEYNRKNANEIDAIFLTYLHTKYGLEHDQLREAYFGIYPAIKALADRYEMHDKGDQIWLATYQLKEMGIDIEEWSKELEQALYTPSERLSEARESIFK